MVEYDGFKFPERFELIAVQSPTGIALYEAPAYSNIKVGEMIENEYGRRLEVIGVRSINLKYDDDEFTFELAVTNTELPLPRAKARIWKSELEYDDDDEN